jgi:hypothetical protein
MSDRAIETSRPTVDSGSDDLAAVIAKLQKRVTDMQRVPQPPWRRLLARPRATRRRAAEGR